MFEVIENRSAISARLLGATIAIATIVSIGYLLAAPRMGMTQVTNSPLVPVTIAKPLPGAGTVTVTALGTVSLVSCGDQQGTCTYNEPAGAPITLKATPAAGNVFTAWGVPCVGSTNPTCQFTLSGSWSAGVSVTAKFTPTPTTYTLTVNRGGVGWGSANVINGQGVAGGGFLLGCPNELSSYPCTVTLPANSALTITAAPASGSVFGGWQGCVDQDPKRAFTTGICYLTLTGNATVTATYNSPVPMSILNVVKLGPGQGKIVVSASTSSSPAASICDVGLTACNYAYPTGTHITFTATPGPNSASVIWGYPCAGSTQSTCSFTLSGNSTVAAKFTTTIVHTINIVKTGGGIGSVTVSAPYPLQSSTCGPTTQACSFLYPDGTKLSLNATPGTGSASVIWGVPCVGSTQGTCSYTLSMDISVALKFTTWPLTFQKTGSGKGSVQMFSIGADSAMHPASACAGNCTIAPAQGSLTSVWLVATPDGSSVFTGWSGGCGGTQRTCRVTLPSTVVANFATPTLTYTKAGAKGGRVDFYGAGPDGTVSGNGGCGTSCNITPAAPGALGMGWIVATPDPGATFSGWSGGGCGGNNRTCQVTLPASVTATFN